MTENCKYLAEVIRKVIKQKFIIL